MKFCIIIYKIEITFILNLQCKNEENIPKEVVEYFDEMDQSNINAPFSPPLK